jgi:hypothetical protein
LLKLIKKKFFGSYVDVKTVNLFFEKSEINVFRIRTQFRKIATRHRINQLFQFFRHAEGQPVPAEDNLWDLSTSSERKREQLNIVSFLKLLNQLQNSSRSLLSTLLNIPSA